MRAELVEMLETCTPTRIGLDVGFGDVKLACYVDGALRTIDFPAILGPAEERVAITTGLGGRRQRVQTITCDGQSYFVGEGVFAQSRFSSARQDAHRIGSPEERILMLAALARADIESALVITGLPILWWDRRRDLVRSWVGIHQIEIDGKPRTIEVQEVRPVWQPMGSLYAHLLGDDGAARVDEATMRKGYAIVDIGTNTTDLSAIVNLQPMAQWSGGIRLGVRDALAIIAADIERRYSVRRSLPEIAQALRAGRGIDINRETYTLDGAATTALSAFAQEVVSEVTQILAQPDRFHTILITGGGAYLVGQALKAAFPANAEILPRPALGNAIGFARYAQRRIFQADKHADRR